MLKLSAELANSSRRATAAATESKVEIFNESFILKQNFVLMDSDFKEVLNVLTT